MTRTTLLFAGAVFVAATIGLTQFSSAQTSDLLSSEILGESVLAADVLPIRDMLDGKSAAERAEIKATEMAKLNVAGTYTEDGITIEIRSIEKIAGGVQLFARAWKGGNPLGLGPNGTTEWERFRIYNPPILVPDPEGNIERSSEDAGITTTLRYKEDPLAALRSTLAHTIRVSSKEGGVVVPGRVGNTTSTFFPDADPESTSIDGMAYRITGSESWATIRAGAGTHTADTQTAEAPVFLEPASTGDSYTILRRGIFLFDTSSIPDTDTVTSATLSFASSGKNNNASFSSTSSLDPHVVASTPASSNSIAASDYGQIGATSFGSVTYDSIVTDSSTYNDISLDANGRAAVSTTGVTKYGVRAGADFSDTSPAHPGWVSSGNSRVNFVMADNTGTSADPKLVVVHSAAPSAPTSLLTNGLSNPTNLTGSTPEFSAVYNDGDSSDAAVSYQIEVSTSSSFASVYWDSGKTTLASSTPQGTRIAEISYGGAALASSTTYYWRIKFWDSLDLAGAWSTETATFSLTGPSSKVRKSVNESLTSSTALQSDDELRVGVSASTSYLIDGVVFASSTSATPDLVISFSAPNSAIIAVGYTNDTAEEALLESNATSSRIALQANTPKSIHIKGTVKMSSTAGDLILKWAQATANAAATTVLQGSYLKVEAI
jgi:hypothetical protein